MSDSESSDGSCLGTILLFILIWILLFGVTISGKHYELGFSCNDGVTFNSGTAVVVPD